MRVAIFSARTYDRTHLDRANRRAGHALVYFDAHLESATSQLARGFEVVSAFVNDRLDADVLHALAEGGTRLIALRCAGFNQVDLAVAAELGIRIVRVPAYSPHAVAEHTIALILALNRHIPRAVGRVRDGNFALDGLVGFDLHGKTAGVVGTGQIGQVVIRILAGFGCRVLACDPFPSPAVTALGATYVTIETLLAESHVVTLHCPLTPDTHHVMNADAFALLRKGTMVINTSRGGLLDTRAAIAALKSGRLGALGIDVYEEEAALFFEDLSGTVLRDDVFARLLTFPNVIVTAHQAFLTTEALTAIAETTLASITAFAAGDPLPNEVRA
ncbi:MAG: 2-hydroxyacid dehydrogenase [Vicinamibacteraceae bacterium]